MSIRAMLELAQWGWKESQKKIGKNDGITPMD